MQKTALITGVLSQDGAYLAKLLLDEGYAVVGGRRRSASGTPWRLRALGICDRVQIIALELTELPSVTRTIDKIKPDDIYNLAAQSFVKASFDQPIYTCEVDALAVTYLLEVLRTVNPAIKIYQASTSEMFGQTKIVPQDEHTPFHPRSPYAIAKAYSHWMTKNYRDAHGIFACSGVLFNHESPLRSEEFVTRKISRSIALIKSGHNETLELGNIYAKRDWGFAGDYVRGMWLMLKHDEPDDHILATGESHSVKEFVDTAAKCAELDLEWRAESREPSSCPSPGRAVPRLNSGSRRRPPESFPAAPSRRGFPRHVFPFRRLAALAGGFRRSLPAAVLLALAALVTVLPVPSAQAQQALEVGADWSLKPAAIGRGGQFRLLFITSNTRNAESAAIATYNGFVRTRLWDRGHAAFDRVSGSDDFANVVASTSTFDARDNAGMTGTGVPIYWVNGSKVADHYADFFDGTWDDDQNSRNEQGRSQGAANGVFTGSSPDGTASLWPLGGGESVTIARPSASGISPVGSDNLGEIRSASETRPFYGITRIFTVRRAQIATASIQSAPRDMTGGYAVGETIRVRIGFNEAVDVTPASDPPSVWLRVGNEVRRASYASGSGTANLEFTYTVERGDLDSDGVSLCSDTRLDSACEAKHARSDPAMLPEFDALRLNLGTDDTATTGLLDAGTWAGIEGETDRAGPLVWGFDLGTSAAQSAIAAYWPETGRLECLAAFPSPPTLAERGLRDGVGSLYQDMQRRHELILAGANAVDLGGLIAQALTRFGRPHALAADRWREAELRDALDRAGVPPATLTIRGMGWKDGAEDVRAFRRACLEGLVVPPLSLLLRSAMTEARVVMDQAGNCKLAKNAEGGRRVRARDDAAAAAILAVAVGSRRGAQRPRRRRYGLAG